MAMPSPKELKKIAKACREAGIKVFKGDGFELTFSDEALAPKSSRKTSSEVISPANAKFETDSLTEAELLFWSSGESGSAFDPFQENKE